MIFLPKTAFAFRHFLESIFSQTSKDYTVAFYNVENLFDTLDTPGVKDSEYTPQSKKEWNTKRYNEKLSHESVIYRVLVLIYLII